MLSVINYHEESEDDCPVIISALVRAYGVEYSVFYDSIDGLRTFATMQVRQPAWKRRGQKKAIEKFIEQQVKNFKG